MRATQNPVPKTSRPILPIDPFLPEIVESIERNTITLLQAEPGAGKTTRVPAALLSAGWERIYVLEPRRLAARMAARRVASELDEPVGQTVGYRVRYEDVSGPATKICYLTEGVLTRQLLSDGKLPGVRVVVLDEFHERHLETDLASALLRSLQKNRTDLRLLIMSATLSGVQISAPRIDTPGKLFPVSVRYQPSSAAPLEQQVADATGKALAETKGHILVFLPGAAEIRKAISACEGIARASQSRLLPLHGELPPEEQDLAVAPSTQRKIICSTNVAESSVTIEDVEAVIDSGLARVLTHSAWSGLSRLSTEKISQAAAIQRAGRAGRTRAGIAIRLYPESDFLRRPPQLTPEITRADLSLTYLLLAAHGFAWEDLEWLDIPPPDLVESARSLLVQLGALDERGKVTTDGRLMAQWPLHPRLARFVLSASAMGAKKEACTLAAHLAEGRVYFDNRKYGSDIEALLATDLPYGARRLKQQLLDQVRIAVTSRDPSGLEKALLLAFPDRVARKRGERLLLANGGAAQLDRQSFVHGDFLVAIEIEGSNVRIASAIEPDWLLDFFPASIETAEELTWNRTAERVEQTNILRYRQLAVDESSGRPTDVVAASALLATKALEAGAERFADAEELHAFLRRVQFAAEYTAIPPAVLEDALRELASGNFSFSEMRNAGLLAILRAKVPMRQLEEVAPASIRLPTGRQAKIEYHDGRPPSVASRLQDFFGMKETPTVARGAVPLVVHLLAPNQRPVQVTTDLVSFWKNLYPEVRRELSRRYPRHAWPENPDSSKLKA